MKNDGFFAKVYALVKLIPTGKVMTYGQIARAINSTGSAKIVGFAMSCAPKALELPCHRVVNRLGETLSAPIFENYQTQDELLRSEGTPFLSDGRVDLTLALFDPEEDLYL